MAEMDKGEVNGKRLLETIARLITAYQGYLNDLQNELSLDKLDPRGISVAGTYTARRELVRLTDLAEQHGADFSPYTTIAKIEERTTELTAKREKLLRELGKERTLELLIAGLERYINAYAARVRHLVEDWERLPEEEYEEFHLEDQIADIEMLTNRDMVDLLMDELAAEHLAPLIVEKLTEADATLRRHGSVLLGPLLRAGVLERGRRALFEPHERWWHYVDEGRE